MIKKITTILNSPLGFKYKCVFIYNYKNINGVDTPINGTFYIGNPKTKIDEACVTISVFYPNNDSLVDSSIASLILVKYYESCSENKSLPSGDGTIDMLNTSMSQDMSQDMSQYNMYSQISGRSCSYDDTEDCDDYNDCNQIDGFYNF